jgi:hypothetical protein
VAIVSILILAPWLAPSCASCVGSTYTFGQDPSATPPPKQSLDEKSIRALIAQLGDDSFEKREQAEKKLVAAGKAAVGLLKKAVVESGDAEVRERAGVVLRAIRARPGPGVWFPEANVIDLAFSADGRSVAAGCTDGAVRVYDGNTGALRHTFKGHTAVVYSLVFSPNGKTLASCSGIWSPVFNKAQTPGEIIIWDLGKGTAAAILDGSPGDWRPSRLRRTARSSTRPAATGSSRCGTWPRTRPSRPAPDTPGRSASCS